MPRFLNATPVFRTFNKSYTKGFCRSHLHYGCQPFLDDIEAYVFDCDGVIWKGDRIIDGTNETLLNLRSKGKKLYFVTNNSTKSRKEYLKKFKSLGLVIDAEEVLSSSFAAAAYLEKNPLPCDKKVYVIGHQGIGEELDLLGIPHLGGTVDADMVADMSSRGKVVHDRDVGAVVVGFDANINYYKIQYAQLCINENPGCLFIATNLDAVTHLTSSQQWAGNGAMVGAIKGCTGKDPIVVGKPSSLLADCIIEKCACDPSRICMVGDRLDTDILFGIKNGFRTVLTLTGVTSEADLLSKNNDIHPEYYIRSIADLVR